MTLTINEDSFATHAQLVDWLMVTAMKRYVDLSVQTVKR